MLTKILRKIHANHGFMDQEDIRQLAEHDRLRPVLCRFNNGRFTTAAQDAAHFVGIVEDSQRDYLRDVSLPASDPVFSGDFETTLTPRPTNYHGMPAGLATADALTRSRPRSPSDTGLGLTPNYPVPTYRFNEVDCGGAFDGHTVTSDADPGL